MEVFKWNNQCKEGCIRSCASQPNHGTHFYGLKARGQYTNTTFLIVRLEANGEVKRAQFKKQNAKSKRATLVTIVYEKEKKSTAGGQRQT